MHTHQPQLLLDLHQAKLQQFFQLSGQECPRMHNQAQLPLRHVPNSLHVGELRAMLRKVNDQP